jgi:hypothetical protein
MTPTATREQVIDHLSQDVEKEEWELIKKGVIAHWFFKVGDQPGLMVLLSCDSIEEARSLVSRAAAVREGLLEFEIEPVNHFPRFD